MITTGPEKKKKRKIAARALTCNNDIKPPTPLNSPRNPRRSVTTRALHRRLVPALSILHTDELCKSTLSPHVLERNAGARAREKKKGAARGRV